MADSSALCCFPSFPGLHGFYRSREASPSTISFPFSSSSSTSSSSTSFSGKFSPFSVKQPFRLVRPCARDPDDADITGGDDPFGFYPWDPRISSEGGADIQWVPEDRVTLFTSDGLVQIGGSLVPRRAPSSDKKQGRSKTSQRFQRYLESDYMDPNQGLCLGALFDIAATNGLDMGRRLCIFGFCRSIEMLSDVVQDTVLEHGGEVVAAEKASREGLQEKLTMIVAVPLLWGVPPASENLRFAVRSGGGIVEKVYWQWDFL